MEFNIKAVRADVQAPDLQEWRARGDVRARKGRVARCRRRTNNESFGNLRKKNRGEMRSQQNVAYFLD